MTKAIIFDMDGLMFDTETLSIEAWLEAGRLQGYPITEEMVYQLFGTIEEEVNRFFKAQFGDGFDGPKAMADRLDYLERSVREKGVPLKPGLLEILDFLKKEGYQMTIASASQRPLIRLYLELAELDTYFEDYVSGDEVKEGKPAPDIFLKAAELMGVAPKNCMVFEDSENGISAAYRAGMKPVMVPDKVKPCQATKNRLYAEIKTLNAGIALLKGEGLEP